MKRRLLGFRLSERVGRRSPRLLRAWLALLALALAASLASVKDAWADVTIEIRASSAPNRYGSPDFPLWAERALDALENGLGSFGDRATDPAAYEVLNRFVPGDLMVTSGKSWRGHAIPAPPFDRQLGNRVHFGLHAFGDGTVRFRFEDVSLMLSSTEGVLDYSFDFVSEGPNCPGSFSGQPWIGYDWGADRAKGGGDDSVVCGAALIDELVYVGSGNAYWPDFELSAEDRLDKAVLQAAIDHGRDYINANLLVFSGRYEIVGSDGRTYSNTESLYNIAAATARGNRDINELVPRLAQAMTASTLSAITGRIDSVASGVTAAGTLNVAGAPTLHHALTSNARSIEDGTLSLEQVLGRSSFVLPLNAADDGEPFGPGGPAVWGSGDYVNLSGGGDGAVDWDGDIFSVHLGADMRVRADLLAGLSVSRSRGSFDYTDGTGLQAVDGRYESRMTSVHPYVNWLLHEGLSLWATVGYGRGDIEIDDDQTGKQSSDASMKMGAVGVSSKLLSDEDVIAGGMTTLRLKGEGSLTRVDVEGSGRINPLTADVRRLRLALEGSHEHRLDSSGRLIPSVELGLRHDGGDGETGAGVEIGGSLRYVDREAGLTAEGRGRVLVAHQGDYEEWGVSGLLRFDPGADSRGLSLSLVPSWGDAVSGVQRLWDRGTADIPDNDDNPAAGRLNAELSYGFGVLSGRSLLTPYGGLSLAGEGAQRYRIGGRFEFGPALQLSLEGERREPANAAAADHGVMLRGQLHF